MLEITLFSIFICICIKGNGGANKIRGNTGIARITPHPPILAHLWIRRQKCVNTTCGIFTTKVSIKINTFWDKNSFRRNCLLIERE